MLMLLLLSLLLDELQCFAANILKVLFIMVSALPADLSSHVRLQCISVPAKNNVVPRYSMINFFLQIIVIKLGHFFLRNHYKW